ncbi:hypothetical protein ACVIGA_003262 [Bradyrhizobium sp. USDA 3240]
MRSDRRYIVVLQTAVVALKPRQTSDAFAALLFATVAILPFPFASVSSVAISLWCGLVGIAVVGLALRPPAIASPLLLAAIIAVGVASYATILYLQVVARTPSDPLVHPIWAVASEILGLPLEASASIARGQPYLAIGTPLLNLLLFTGGYMCGADETLSRRLLRTIAWSGGLYAVYAICSYALEPNLVLWREKIAYVGNLTGTFTNRNAAAVYFGSIAIVWLLLTFRRLSLRKKRRPGKRRRPSTTGVNWRVLALPGSFFCICLLALVLTGSRAGVACSFAGLLVAFGLNFRSEMSPRLRNWLAFGAAVVVILAIYQIFDSGLGERLETEGAAGGGRASVVASVVRMISDFPWLGSGLGSFRWSFAAYRSSQISGWGVWDRAHNVALEIAAEGGLVLAAIVVLAWIGAMAMLLRACLDPQRSRTLPRAALAVSTVAVLHSLIDFSLQIPAYAGTVIVLLGAALAQTQRPVAEVEAEAVNFEVNQSPESLD